MAKVVESCGKVRDLDAKAFNFCTAEAHQDSLHFQSECQRDFAEQQAKRGLNPNCSISWREKAAVGWLPQSLEGTTWQQETEASNNRQGVTAWTSKVPWCHPDLDQASWCLGVNPKFWVEIMYSKSSDCHPRAASTRVVCSPSSLTFQQNEFAQSKIWEKWLGSYNSQVKLGNVKTDLQSLQYNHVCCDEKSGRVPGPVRMSASFQRSLQWCLRNSLIQLRNFFSAVLTSQAL